MQRVFIALFLLQELRDLEAEFELSKKLLIDAALKDIKDQYQAQREAMVRLVAVHLRALLSHISTNFVCRQVSFCHPPIESCVQHNTALS